VYKDHGGSKCDNLLALEFETTPTGSVGAKADAVLGAAKGANSLHFGTKGWTNITSCDMDDGCTSKMEENSRSFTQEAPAQTRLIRFALNYGEEDGGDACDKRQDQKEKEYLESVKKEEDYKVKKAEEEEKNRMSKCDKGEEYSRTEKDCIKCVDSKYNDEKGGKPCKERITKCPKGQYLDTKDKSLEEDDKCVACEAKEYSDKEVRFCGNGGGGGGSARAGDGGVFVGGEGREDKLTHGHGCTLYDVIHAACTPHVSACSHNIAHNQGARAVVRAYTCCLLPGTLKLSPFSA
jgi:hypothetical protein